MRCCCSLLSRMKKSTHREITALAQSGRVGGWEPRSAGHKTQFPEPLCHKFGSDGNIKHGCFSLNLTCSMPHTRHLASTASFNLKSNPRRHVPILRRSRRELRSGVKATWLGLKHRSVCFDMCASMDNALLEKGARR